jgi:rod shape-determining protein MreB
MFGRTSSDVVVTNLVKVGLIMDDDLAGAYLAELLKHVLQNRRDRRSIIRAVIGIPLNAKDPHFLAIANAVFNTKIKELILVQQPLAAAIGIYGEEIMKPFGRMIIDVGGGTTNIGILSMGRIVEGMGISVTQAGEAFDDALITHLKTTYNVVISETESERIKIAFSKTAPKQIETLEVNGRAGVSGLPKKFEVKRVDVSAAYETIINEIVSEVVKMISMAHPNICTDISQGGITLTGGGANIIDLREQLEKETGVTVNIAENSLWSVGRGLSFLLDKPEFLEMSAHRKLHWSSKGGVMRKK